MSHKIFVISFHPLLSTAGIILERLNSKIIDVERLDRNIERSDDTHNWTIKATIRGEVMRELGVLYNSNYYAISEHPGYGGRRGSGLDDDDDLPDEDDIDVDDGGEVGDSLGTIVLAYIHLKITFMS